MKGKYLLSILVTGFLFLTTTRVFAQASTTASSAATIVAPISIAKNVDMAFGNIAVSATAGTVILSPAGSRSKTGGVTFPPTTGTVAAASFTVSGAASSTYSITLPGSSITLTSGGNNMTASTFTSSLGATGTLSAGGSQTLTVGATLSVAGSQPAGTYTTGTAFTVTVNYN